MPRILELFAKRGFVPLRFHGAVADPGDEGLVVDVHVAGLAADTADHIAACLRGMVYVDRVLMALKRSPVRAGAYA